MTARFGIELAPNACRIIGIDRPAAWSRQADDTRVLSFDLLPASASETRDTLRSLRRPTAAVVVWTPSEHRQVVVTGGSYESMRAEALDALAAAGVQTEGVVADIAPVFGSPRRGVRQPVVVSVAPASELSSQLHPLREAGIRLGAVTTPAVALASLARTRRAFAVPGAIEAYVALEDTATCVALVRDTVLIAARQLPWGYGDERPAGIVTRPRTEIVARLGETISEFVAAIGGDMRQVGQVCVCGGLQELRSTTAPLMEQLDVEVEPLDSLLGIDAAHLPEPADEFRERIAELRVAWAVAADWPPTINLLRARKRQASRQMLSRVAVAAGVVAGVMAGWRVEQSQWWRSTAPKPVARTAPKVETQQAAQAPPPRFIPPPDVGPQLPPAASAVERPAVSRVERPAVSAVERPAVSRVERPAVSAVERPAVSSVVPPPPPDVGPRLPSVIAATAPAVTMPPPPPDVGPKLPAGVTAAPPAASRSAAPARGVTELKAKAEPAPPARGQPTPAAPPTRVEPQPTRAQLPPTRLEPTPTRAALPPTRVEPPPTRVEPPPTRIESAPTRVESAPIRREPPPMKAEPPPSRVEPPLPAKAAETPASSTVERASRPSAMRAQPPPPQPAPLPFDASLGTILYSADRKLAIIDGKIVGLGDDVRGARVIEITQTAVLLRDAQGRLRRLALAGGR